MVFTVIIGKPNSGKSSFFKSLTFYSFQNAKDIVLESDFNLGKAFVIADCPDKLFNKKCNPREGFCKHGKRYIPIDIMDTPGIIRRNSEKNLEDKFVHAIKDAEGFINVIDISGTTDENGKGVVLGSYDPLQDFEWVENEIYYWFYSRIKKNILSIKRKIFLDKNKKFEKVVQIIQSFKISREKIIYSMKKFNIDEDSIFNIDDETLFKFLIYLFRLSKPFVYVANKIDLISSKKYYEKALKKYKDKIILPASSYIELGLLTLEKEGKIEYFPLDGEIIIKKKDKYTENFVEYAKMSFFENFKVNGVFLSLNTLIFNLLGYIVVYPVKNIDLTDSNGNVMPDAIFLKYGSNIRDLARRIHKDLDKDIIKGIELKTKKILSEEDILQNGDVIKIL